ncbi:HTH-type transcriptional regulator HdfR [bioreactor metagenome]|uniref:HTH-type transcriptional regulator HdfR n=1 Tax=bioreactor metagenome TaxID=1076179 RepID=A0A644UJZ8_9ZZZZ
MQQTTRDFWNDRYREKTGETSGKPGLVLSQFAGPLAPGRALELGCGRGDDALWLAQQGWRVTAVDVSAVALAYASDSASRAELAGNIRFEEHDLAETFPKGSFDLVVASFLQSPQDWPRARARSPSVAEALRLRHRAHRHPGRGSGRNGRGQRDLPGTAGINDLPARPPGRAATWSVSAPPAPPTLGVAEPLHLNFPGYTTGDASPARQDRCARPLVSTVMPGAIVLFWLRDPSLRRPRGMLDCLAHDIEPHVDLCIARRQRWRDAEHRPHRRDLDDVHAQAARHRRGRDPVAHGKVRLLAGAIRHDLESEQQSAPAHVADAIVALLKRAHPVAQAPAGLGRPRDQPVARDHVQHRKPHRRRQRIRDMRGQEDEAPFMRRLLNLTAGQHRRQRQSRPQRLGQCQDVRRHAVALESEHGAGAPDAGLRLVEDQQHLALLAFALERGQITHRQFDDPARGQDRLGDEGRKAAGRLGVDQGEGIVQFGLPVEAAIGVPEARTIFLRRGNGKGADRGRPVALARGTVGGRGRAAGHAVPALGKGDDFVLAGHAFGQADCGLVSLAAGRQQHRLFKPGHHTAEPGAQFDDRRGEHPAEQVIQPADLIAHDAHHLRVGMAKQRAHLPRGEVEDRGALAVIDEAALGALDDPPLKDRTVVHHMVRDIGPEPVVSGRIGHGALHCVARPCYRQSQIKDNSFPCIQNRVILIPMPTLDIALLRSFIAVSRAGSIRAAAERVGRTQSAVSLQIKRLEAIVGDRLFHRMGSGLALTVAGERFLAGAERILAAHDETLEGLGSESVQGSLAFGCPED